MADKVRGDRSWWQQPRFCGLRVWGAAAWQRWHVRCVRLARKCAGDRAGIASEPGPGLSGCFAVQTGDPRRLPTESFKKPPGMDVKDEKGTDAMGITATLLGLLGIW